MWGGLLGVCLFVLNVMTMKKSGKKSALPHSSSACLPSVTILQHEADSEVEAGYIKIN